MQRDGGPGGAGGAGNPTGGSFTGPAEALEIVGNHAYAYTGETPLANSQQTILEFTSGNYLFVGEITVSGPIKVIDISYGDVVGYTLSFNGVTVMLYKCETTNEDSPATITAPIIIPSYTDVKLEVIGDTSGADQYTTACLTGRIHRG